MTVAEMSHQRAGGAVRMRRVWIPLAGLPWERAVGYDAELWNGAALRERREGASLTCAELAAAIGVCDTCTISSWERGARAPSPLMVAVLACYFGCAPRAFCRPS